MHKKTYQRIIPAFFLKSKEKLTGTTQETLINTETYLTSGIGDTALSPQMSLLYSAIVRSDEKRPLAAVLKMLMRVQCSSLR